MGKNQPGNWLQVRTPDGKVGWMAVSLLRVNIDTSQIAVAQTPPTPTPSAMAGMVFVPAGEFLMGSSYDQGRDDEHPQHTVTLDAFWIDKTEVTNEMFARFVEKQDIQLMRSGLAKGLYGMEVNGRRSKALPGDSQMVMAVPSTA